MWKQKPTQYSESKTIPGQALKPSELMKRHLAGTLPDIDRSAKFEYHYDEEGNQIGEPFPVEMHELHTLAVAIRKRQYEEELAQRKKRAQRDRDRIIAEYLKTQKQAQEPIPSDPPKGV